MFRMAFLSALTLGLCFISEAQENHTIDSLVQVSKKAKSPIEKANALHSAGKLYLDRKSFPEAFNHFQSAQDIYKESSFHPGIARSNQDIGVLYSRQGKEEEAMRHYEIALKHYEISHDKTNLDGLYNSIGSSLIGLGKFDSAIINLQKALALAEETKDEKEQNKIYYNLGFACNSQKGCNDPSQALAYFRSGLTISEKFMDKEMAAIYAEAMAIVYRCSGNITESLKYFNMKLKLDEQLGKQSDIARDYANIGITFQYSGNYAEAGKNYEIALRINETLNNKQAIGRSHEALGTLNSSQSKFGEAMIHFLKALENFDEIKDKKGVRDIYNAMAWIYYNQQEYEKSLKNYSAALSLSEELNDKAAIPGILNGIANVYNDQHQFGEAIKIYEKNLTNFEENGHKQGLATTYKNIGTAFSRQGNHEEAIKKYQTSLEIIKSTGERPQIAETYCDLGETYLDNQDFQNARLALNEGLVIAKEVNNSGILKNIYQNLSRADSATGKWKEAFENHLQFVIYKDSLINENNATKISELQIQYETDRKDKEIELLHSQQLISNLEKDRLKTINLLNLQELDLVKSESEKQQILLDKKLAEVDAHENALKLKEAEVRLLQKEKALQDEIIKNQKQVKKYTFSGILLLTFLAAFAYKNHNTRQKLKLQSLRNKISTDLHDDVGSTLSSIYIFSEMAKSQSDEVMPMLNTIGESSKKMLDAMADIVWTINPENDQFEKIIERMQIFAFELLGAKKIDFEFEAGENLHQLKLPMDVRKNLYLIFKEATNNLVKYAAANKAHFSIKEENKHLTMTIQDNGKGFDPASPSQGNGLKNMKKRAEEIGGKLSVVSKKEQGTTITLSVAV